MILDQGAEEFLREQLPCLLETLFAAISQKKLVNLENLSVISRVKVHVNQR